MTPDPNMVFLLCSMRLSELLDPRRLAAMKAAREAAENAAPEGDGEGNPWAAEDASALASQLADLAELRALAMGMARAVAAEVAEGGAASANDNSDDGPLAPSVTSASRRDTFPMNGGGAEGRGLSVRGAQLALDRLARTVRLTTMLDRRLRDERARGVVLAASAKARAAAGSGRGREDEGVERQSQLSPEVRARINADLMRIAIKKMTIVGVIREVLEADGQDAEVIEDVGRVLGERLLDWDAGDLNHLPIGRMVARYLHQIRKSPDWSLFKDRDWAIEEARTNARGSPFGNPEVLPTYWCAGEPVPHQDMGVLAALARGYADVDEDDEGDEGEGPPGSSP